MPDTRKIGVSILHELLEQAQLIQTEFPKNSIRMWLFAHEGLTKEAEQLATSEGILWSDRAQLDGMLNHLRVRTLPVLEE